MAQVYEIPLSLNQKDSPFNFEVIQIISTLGNKNRLSVKNELKPSSKKDGSQLFDS